MKASNKKITNTTLPDGMSLSQWQVELRRQAAEKAKFLIREKDLRLYPGYYIVNNPISKHEYSVVYRGEGSRWKWTSRRAGWEPVSI